MRNIGISLLCFIVLVAPSHQSINYRLPNDSKPYHYEIRLIPHIIPGNFTFEGESEIFLDVLYPTKNVTLHSLNLIIHEESTLLIGDEGNIVPDRHIFEEEPQFLILNFQHDLKPGHYILKLKYSGVLSNNQLGFFRNSYLNDKKERVYLVATQFETTFARQAFPCWDEPALKATFDISIKHFPNYTALSNMPVERKIVERKIDGKIWTKFETTPLMSTYIVSFTVSDFGNITNSQGNFSMWTRKNALGSVQFMYDVGLKTFPVLEEYTKIKYQFPKMDVIGIPKLLPEAMENWGLITFEERYLFQKNNSSISDMLDPSMVMVHEIAHQWFGNLISPTWWSDIWITEGLATYFQYFFMSKVLNFPRVMDYFVIGNNYIAIESDVTSISEALYLNLNTPYEIFEHSSNVHDKGAAMMHMLSGLISKEVFRDGIIKLLKEYKFKAITTDDFWKTMQEALNESKLPHSNLNIKMVMDSFISQPGYPEINVNRDYTTGVIKLTQTNYHPDGRRESKFWVPINIAKSSNLNFSSTFATHWMDPEEKELIIEGIDPDDWFIINIQSSGYYRVNYDETNWKRLIDYLHTDKFRNIHVLNRAQLLNDAIWFYLRKKLDESVLLTLTFYLFREVDFIPWNSGHRILKVLIKSTSIPAIIKKMMLTSLPLLVDQLLENTGMKEKPDDDIFTIKKRKIGIYWRCLFAQRDCSEITENN